MTSEEPFEGVLDRSRDKGVDHPPGDLGVGSRAPISRHTASYGPVSQAALTFNLARAAVVAPESRLLTR
jgi:hypothetical protein